MTYFKSLAVISLLAFIFGCGSAPKTEPPDKDGSVVGVVDAPNGMGLRPMVPQESQPKPKSKSKKVRPPAVVDP
ncbi:hypothetical protein BH11ARM1_BH11ARM1_17200 [soil metagenome]